MALETAKNNTVFLHYKKRFLKECATVNPNGVRFNCIQYLCSFPGLDPVEMAAHLQNEGVAVLFDDSSISRADNKANQKKVARKAKELAALVPVNPMCISCANYGPECAGTAEKIWTGCVYKKPVHKMRELYTAYYGDRRAVYEKTLEYIYQNRNGQSVEIRPTIWLWKSDRSQVFFVDYVGAEVGCTLATFDTLKEAEAYREKIANMTETEFEAWLLEVRWNAHKETEE